MATGSLIPHDLRTDGKVVFITSKMHMSNVYLDTLICVVISKVIQIRCNSILKYCLADLLLW